MYPALLFMLFAHKEGTKLLGFVKPGSPHDEFIHLEHQIRPHLSDYYKQLWAILVYQDYHADECRGILYTTDDYRAFREHYADVPVGELVFFLVPRRTLLQYGYIDREDLEKPNPAITKPLKALLI